MKETGRESAAKPPILSPRALRNERCHSERREESKSKPLQFVYLSFLNIFKWNIFKKKYVPLQPLKLINYVYKKLSKN